MTREAPRTALVTGAASGIGAATAAELRSRGLHVVGLDLVRAEDCDQGLVCDVTDAAGVGAAVGELGPIDILVTAAGYYETTDLVAIAPEAWRRMLRVHLEGTFNVIAAVLPGMYERRRGAVCTIASELALLGDAAAPHYAAAKGAVIALTKAIAVEAAPRGVRVNTVAPGPCDTPLLSAAHRSRAAVRALPLGRLLRPEEVAAAIVWLVVEQTNLVGQVISPNGGAVI